jgi:hypothetical protein
MNAADLVKHRGIVWQLSISVPLLDIPLEAESEMDEYIC